jgi:hypothetical protein
MRRIGTRYPNTQLFINPTEGDIQEFIQARNKPDYLQAIRDIVGGL